MSYSNVSAESQNTRARQEGLPSQPAQHSQKRSYSNMSAENQNKARAEPAGMSTRLALFPPATTQPSQVPPGTVRQRDWASGEAKEFAARQDLIVSEDWEAVAHQKTVHLLDLANDAWDEQEPAARQDKIKTVIEMQRSHCDRLVPVMYRDFDRLSDNLLRFQEKNNPADEAAIKAIRELLKKLDHVYGELKTVPANDELSWSSFYEAHRLVICVHLLLGDVRDGFTKQEQREANERRNGLRNGQPSDQPREQESQQQSSSQHDGQQNDLHLEVSGSSIVQQSGQHS